MSHSSKERPEADDLSVLIEEAKRGSFEAVGRLLDRHRDYLLLIAGEELTRTGNQMHTPSDIVQWTQLEVCRDFGAFRGQTPGEFRAWLRRILMNNLADNRRRVQLPQVPLTADPQSDDPTPSVRMAAEEVNRTMLEFIATLPGDEQKVIQLRYFEGKAYAEIGAVIGRTTEATRKLWTRTLARLQSYMRRHS